MKPGKVCSRCWRDHPCPIHTRPANARWSKDRDGAAQHHFRRAVLDRDGHHCTYPGCNATTNLVAHHVKPGYEPSAGKTLCEHHHRMLDNHAR